MADIKQAAKWMSQGKNVRRLDWGPGYIWHVRDVGTICATCEGRIAPTWVSITDLLAEDWEVACHKESNDE